VVGGFHALGREQAGDPLRVVLVHLAPVGAHVEPLGHDPTSLRVGTFGPDGRATQRQPTRNESHVCAGFRAFVGLVPRLQGQASTSSSSSSSSLVRSTSVSAWMSSIPDSRRTRSLISTIKSTFSDKKFFTFSRPWPSCSPS